VSSWIPLRQISGLWHCRPSLALRRIEKLGDAVEINEDGTAVRLTWPEDLVASFAGIHVGSMTEG
jgi:hypothetical protein